MTIKDLPERIRRQVDATKHYLVQNSVDPHFVDILMSHYLDFATELEADDTNFLNRIRKSMENYSGPDAFEISEAIECKGGLDFADTDFTDAELNYEGAMSDLDSAIDVLIARINGEKDLESAATWVRLNYPEKAKKIK